MAVSIAIVPAPGGASTANHLVFGVIGVPGPGDVTQLPVGLGTMCFAPSLLSPANSSLFFLATSFGAFAPLALVSAPPAPFTFNVPGGLPSAISFALQAGIEVSPGNLAVTNAVLVTVH